MKKLIALLTLMAGLASAGQISFDFINADSSEVVTGAQSNALVSVQTQADANYSTNVTQGANIETNEAAALSNAKQYHYGDPDIEITPTNAFTFNPATGTITEYSGSYTDIVIP